MIRGLELPVPSRLPGMGEGLKVDSITDGQACLCNDAATVTGKDRVQRYCEGTVEGMGAPCRSPNLVLCISSIGLFLSCILL